MYMKKNKILTAKKIKIILQQRKVLVRQCQELKLGMSDDTSYEWHIDSENFNRICKIFNISPDIDKDRDGDYIEKKIYMEGFKITALFYKKKEREMLDFGDQWYYDKFAKYCVIHDSKEDAFKAFYEAETKNDNRTFKSLLSRKRLDTYKKFDRYLRKKKYNRSYKTILSDYGLYRVKWEKYNEESKYDDYSRPLTLKEYINEN